MCVITGCDLVLRHGSEQCCCIHKNDDININTGAEYEHKVKFTSALLSILLILGRVHLYGGYRQEQVDFSNKLVPVGRP